ncbi:MAG: hypothetical protein PVG66_15420 [Chromatiales bacterium]|jgi:hypothetical protein
MSTELGKIWVFDESKLAEALQRYEQASIAAYPQHQDKIELTLAAVNDFLHSEYADKLRMAVKPAVD